MTKILHLTITEEGTIERINDYANKLGVKPTSVIALAMRKNLPELKQE